MACLVMGDSLAVGVGQFRPECETDAKVGITSQTYLETRFPVQGVSADTVVISLGVNDGDTSGTLENLRSLRARVKAGSVYWLLPGLKEEVRRAIRDVAADYGDQLIDTRPEVGRDHLHPSGAGYQRLAALVGGDRRGEVEVAYAPSDLRMPSLPGRNYPPRLHASTSFNKGLATPRERIRRLKALRSADTSAPLARHGLSDVPYRQRELRVTPALHRTGDASGHHCSSSSKRCQTSVKSTAQVEQRDFHNRDRVQTRVIAYQR